MVAFCVFQHILLKRYATFEYGDFSELIDFITSRLTIYEAGDLVDKLFKQGIHWCAFY